ncbi:SO_0444 family Cu/Zn efflux transporter [Kiritimatiella glycovorans]|uniref:Putative permease n=1 Tax=Kiritimatiella glycovorans TaxID=1307763 RepID=A0A0G3EIM7_9BACT|nr:SO_0444 family Cu/Zn efflux transporter [Kiritimatiella glycovorans]AKJ65292.1 putative permease [Kiritimatiella glycovorans]
MNEMSPYLLFGFVSAGVLSVLIRPSMVERHLGGRGWKPVVRASVLGVPMPLCSCGVIPVTAGLRRHGASRGASVSFLASTPQTGVDSIAVSYSLLGGVFTLIRVVAAFAAGIFCGFAVDWRRRDEPMQSGEETLGDASGGDEDHAVPRGGMAVRALRYGLVSLPQEIGRAVLLGILISAALGVLLPENLLAGRFGTGFTGMLVMLAVGIPIYVCSTASAPVAMALMHAGASPGAALVFLIAGPGTNAATVTTLWKTMGPQSLIRYLAALTLCALAFGWLTDALPLGELIRSALGEREKHAAAWRTVCSIALLVVLAQGVFPGTMARLGSALSFSRDS